MGRLRSAAALITVSSLLSTVVPGGVASGGPTGAVVDGFNRVASSSLGAAETGQAWATWSGRARIAVNQAELHGNAYNLAVVNSGITAGSAAVTVTAVSPEYWLVFRASTKGNYWRFGRKDGAYRLQKVVSNSVGTLTLTNLATVTPAVGDRLSCQYGTTVTCSVNGLAVVSATDGFNASASFTGLAAVGGTAARFDDLLVQVPPSTTDLRVAVTAGAASASTYGPVSWTATVTNAGSTSATAASVSISAPSGLTNTSVTTSAGTCTAAGTGWDCGIGNRPPGSVVTITVNATAPAQPASLTLTATATAVETDADPADNSADATVTTTTPPPAGAVVMDGFARADAATLGQAQTGQAWAMWSGSASIDAEQALVPPGAYALAVLDSGISDGTASLKVPAASSEYWLVVRAADAANYWRFGRRENGAYQLQQVVANALGSPALTSLTTVTPAAGDTLSCRLASALTCSVNGTAVVRTASTFNATARFVGLAAVATTPTRFDDLLVSTPQPGPDLAVAVAAAAGTVGAGAPASWSVTVSNHGTTAAGATSATVTVPTALTGVTLSPSAGSCAASGGTWTCSLGTRDPSSVATITVAGTAPNQPGSLTVSAVASSQEADLDPSDNAGEATVTVQAAAPAGTAASDDFARPDSATLGVAGTGQAWEAWVGSARVVGQQAETAAGYSLAVLDTGIADGTVAVTVPAVTSEFWLIVRGSDPGNYWRFGRWAGGTYELQKIVANALGAPALTPLATITPAGGDRLSCRLATGLTCSVNGTATVRSGDGFNATARFAGLAGTGQPRFDDLSVTRPEPGPDLTVAVTAAASTVNTGSPASWVATVRNDGTTTATATVVTVTPPPGVTGTSVTTSAGSCASSGATWTCSVGNRAVGSSMTVDVTATAPSTPGTITLGVAAAAQETDVDPSTDSASSTVTVVAPPPPGTIMADGFGRADSPSLGAAETGQAWTAWSGTARVSGQQAEAPGTAYTLATADSGTAAGTAAVTVLVVPAEFWLVVRGTDSANYWRFGRWQDGPYQLQQVAANNLGSPALTTSATVTAAAGDRLSCRLATGLTCSVNGTQVVATADGFNAGGRLTGFAAGSGAVARFDDLLVTTPPPGPDLRVGVSAASSSVTVAEPVSWTATVDNDGTTTATAATATVTVPGGVTGTTVTPSVGTCTPGGGTWTCALGSRPAGSSATLTVTGTAPAQPGTVTLHVSATSTESDTDPSNNAASSSVVVQAPPVPGTVVIDHFSRPNASTLGLAETGQAWTTVAGGFGVSDGTAAPAGAGTNMALLDPGWAYGTFQVKVTAGAAVNAFSVVIRGKDANNNFRIGPDSSGYYRLWKVIGGVVQPLQFSARRADVVARDGDVIRVVNRPDDGFFVSVNGQHVLDAGDTTLLTERRFGLAASSAAVRFDAVWIGQTMSSGVTTSDTFSAPDGTSLRDRQTESGTHYQWRATYGWAIQSGRAVIPSYGLMWVDTSSEQADARVEIRSATADAWLVFRYAETGDYYRLGHRAGGNYVVERYAGGASVAGAGAVTSVVTPGAADLVEVRQTTDGRVRCYVNGALICDFVDTTFNLRATAYGLEGEAATFDDFVSVSR